MKKRLIIILVFCFVGIITIEIYIHQKYPEQINYLELNYTISYDEIQKNPPKFLTENDLYSYYFVHFDNNSTITYENKETFSLIEAYELGYIFLGDLLKEVNIQKKTKFSFEFIPSKENTLKLNYHDENINIYYYELDKINFQTIDYAKNLNDALEEKTISKEDILKFLQNYSITEEKDYTIYQKDNIKVYIDKLEKNIYFGSSKLNEKIIKKGEQKNE